MAYNEKLVTPFSSPSPSNVGAFMLYGKWRKCASVCPFFFSYSEVIEKEGVKTDCDLTGTFDFFFFFSFPFFLNIER